MENRRYEPKHYDRSGKRKSDSSRVSSRNSSSTSSTSSRTTRTTQRSTRPTGTRSAQPSRSESVTRRPVTSRTTNSSTQRNTTQTRSVRQNPVEPQKTGCAIASLYFIVIFGISVCLSLFIIFAANDVLALVKEDRDITVVVPADTTVSGVSKFLDNQGVINYGSLFRIINAVKGDSDVIVSAGVYTLNPTMDYDQIIRSMTKTTSTTNVKITIPEGYTVNQIEQTLLQNKVTSSKLLDNALNQYSYKHEFLKDIQPPSHGWLEGYLFPDTYEFTQDSKQPVYEVINVMLNNFDKKYDEKIREGAESLGLTTHEVVIIASLIEREAKAEDEFAKISGVIHNRLNNQEQFPYLQVDASLQYAVGHNNPLTDADKQLDSPYNLYQHKGLPPGPICNPGYNALYAATHPQEHGYYYYVAMPDGTHLFAKTNEQHNKNRRKADAAWEAQKQN